ncbi:uncharacterized protein LOC119673932 [Teleopsis dalmanni]|uniref:uncharacterized protein LOC119673932 n=1 Tax=Teleopsis dalmanni TaxID=139649 RepID=UPI0018CEE57A|nr:uncharacterized protein LOC119673932 [Teleopsis dalmanni]
MSFNKNKTFCKETEDLLREWDMEELIPDFVEKQVDLEVLKNLTVDDINLLIECFGLRIRFRTKLNKWREDNDLPLVISSASRNERRTSTHLARRHFGNLQASEFFGRKYGENCDEMTERPRVSYTQNNNTYWSHNTVTLNLSGPFPNFFK